MNTRTRITLMTCNNPRCASAAQVQHILDGAHAFARRHALPLDALSVRCMELCGAGPHVVLHGVRGDVSDEHRAADGGVAYDRVDADALARILDGHVLRGIPEVSHLHDPSRRR